MINDETKVAVCAECFTAACWQGEVLCESSHDADVTEAPVWVLQELALEDPCFWDVDEKTGRAKKLPGVE